MNNELDIITVENVSCFVEMWECVAKFKSEYPNSKITVVMDRGCVIVHKGVLFEWEIDKILENHHT